MPVSEFHFHAELNDFLPSAHREIAFAKSFSGTPSVKDVVESCGVPHTEIDLIVVNGESVDFHRLLRGGERIEVFPIAEGPDTSTAIRLCPAPETEPRFLVDANLRRLVGLLRLLGFDTHSDQEMSDGEIAATAAAAGLTILTRDRGLLMRKIVWRAYYVRSLDPVLQAAEVVRRFDLPAQIRVLSRCGICNGVIRPVPKDQISHLLPANTRIHYERFYRCPECGKLFWRGAHWKNIVGLVERVRSAAIATDPRDV